MVAAPQLPEGLLSNYSRGILLCLSYHWYAPPGQVPSPRDQVPLFRVLYAPLTPEIVVGSKITSQTKFMPEIGKLHPDFV